MKSILAVVTYVVVIVASSIYISDHVHSFDFLGYKVVTVQ